MFTCHIYMNLSCSNSKFHFHSSHSKTHLHSQSPTLRQAKCRDWWKRPNAEIGSHGVGSACELRSCWARTSDWRNAWNFPSDARQCNRWTLCLEWLKRRINLQIKLILDKNKKEYPVFEINFTVIKKTYNIIIRRIYVLIYRKIRNFKIKLSAKKQPIKLLENRIKFIVLNS